MELGKLVRIRSGKFKGFLGRIVNKTEYQVTVKLIGETCRRDFAKDEVKSAYGY